MLLCLRNYHIANYSMYVYCYVHYTVYYCTYGTAQFKLDRTRVQHGLNMTHFSFPKRASMLVHARLMTSNLPCIALVYALDLHTDARVHVRMHTPNLDYACMQTVSQGQRNKLYKHVHVLRCNHPRDTRRKSC